MTKEYLAVPATTEWSTPQDLYDRLDQEFSFTLDPCATADNAKCARFFTKADDGLQKHWEGSVFVNPPYGRELPLWVEKAYRESSHCRAVVLLIPSRTDTKYWHDFIEGIAEVRFVRGRLKFGGAQWNAPFASAVVIYRGLL